jgi:hypothetical protein
MTSFATRGDRSAAAQLFLGASIVAALVLIFTTWLQMRRVPEAPTTPIVPANNSYITAESLKPPIVPQGGLLAGVQIAALVFANALQLLTMFVVAVWVHRAYANLAHLGKRTTYTPFAAAAYVVVPLANLIVPHAVFDELWRGSDPSGVRSLKRVPVRPIDLVSKWWYLFIGYSVTSNVAAALLVRRSDPRTVQVALIVAGIAGILASIVGIDMIRLIDMRQQIRRSGQAGRSVATPPVLVPAAERRAPAGWREILLPVVTSAERELEEEAEQAEQVPPFELDELETMPRDLAPPKPRVVSVLLLIAAALSFLQALGAATNLQGTGMPGFAAFFVLVFPFAVPLYAVTIAAGVAFSLWLHRAYGNLRAYMTPPRSHLSASTDFVRRAGDPEVLAELWAVTMSLSSTPSAALVERWGRAWRVMQFLGIVMLVGLVALPGRVTLAIMTVFFALLGWTALLARRLVREVSAEQVTRLDALAERQARAAALRAAPVPPAIPL